MWLAGETKLKLSPNYSLTRTEIDSPDLLAQTFTVL